MRVEFKTLVDTPEEYRITLKIIDGGREYRQDHILAMIGLDSENIQREKDYNVSELIRIIMEGIQYYKNKNSNQ